MHTTGMIIIPNIGMLSVTPKTYHFLDEYHTSFLTVCPSWNNNLLKKVMMLLQHSYFVNLTCKNFLALNFIAKKSSCL